MRDSHKGHRRRARRHLLRDAPACVVLGGIGLTGWLAKADYVVIAALILCLGPIVFGLYRRRIRRG